MKSLNRIRCTYLNYQNMEGQLLPNSDVELYRFALKLDNSVMDKYVFVYFVKSSVLKMKIIFFYILIHKKFPCLIPKNLIIVNVYLFNLFNFNLENSKSNIGISNF